MLCASKLIMTNLALSLEMFVLLVGLFFIAYANKNQLSKWYKYVGIFVTGVVACLIICTTIFSFCGSCHGQNGGQGCDRASQNCAYKKGCDKGGEKCHKDAAKQCHKDKKHCTKGGDASCTKSCGDNCKKACGEHAKCTEKCGEGCKKDGEVVEVEEVIIEEVTE